MGHIVSMLLNQNLLDPKTGPQVSSAFHICARQMNFHNVLSLHCKIVPFCNILKAVFLSTRSVHTSVGPRAAFSQQMTYLIASDSLVVADE